MDRPVYMKLPIIVDLVKKNLFKFRDVEKLKQDLMERNKLN
jgi:hypothetical protein